MLLCCILGLFDYSHGFLLNRMFHRRALRKTQVNAAFDCDVIRNSQIFCNVELTGASIQAVGFDMDYTLAQVGGLTAFSIASHYPLFLCSTTKSLTCLHLKEPSVNFTRSSTIPRMSLILNTGKLLC